MQNTLAVPPQSTLQTLGSGFRVGVHCSGDQQPADLSSTTSCNCKPLSRKNIVSCRRRSYSRDRNWSPRCANCSLCLVNLAANGFDFHI